MDKYYKKNIKEIFEYFKSSEHGLTDSQYEKNKKDFGTNVIKEKENKSIIKVFFEQFKDMLVIILVISAIISIFLNEIESTIVIFVVLTINALLGTYQYQKAQKSLDSLRNLSSPISYVIRNKEVKKIRSYDLVCGDVVIINTGDVISADGRIIEEEGIEINESSLTGESIAVKKNKRNHRHPLRSGRDPLLRRKGDRFDHRYPQTFRPVQGYLRFLQAPVFRSGEQARRGIADPFRRI